MRARHSHAAPAPAVLPAKVQRVSTNLASVLIVSIAPVTPPGLLTIRQSVAVNVPGPRTSTAAP